MKVGKKEEERWQATTVGGCIFDIACANQTKLWAHTESLLVQLPPNGSLMLTLPSDIPPIKLKGHGGKFVSLSLAVHGSPSLKGDEVQMQVLGSTKASTWVSLAKQIKVCHVAQHGVGHPLFDCTFFFLPPLAHRCVRREPVSFALPPDDFLFRSP